MMVTQKCVQCGHVYEYYQFRKVLKDCPRCGSRGGFEPVPKKSLLRKHGEAGPCPTCSEPGRFDTETPSGMPAAFPDSIWYNNYTKSWECHDCWLK